MKLDKEKIQRLKKVYGFTWADISKAGKLKSRQAAFYKWRDGSALQAQFFAKVFDLDPKDLIK